MGRTIGTRSQAASPARSSQTLGDDEIRPVGWSDRDIRAFDIVNPLRGAIAVASSCLLGFTFLISLSEPRRPPKSLGTLTPRTR